MRNNHGLKVGVRMQLEAIREVIMNSHSGEDKAMGRWRSASVNGAETEHVHTRDRRGDTMVFEKNRSRRGPE